MSVFVNGSPTKEFKVSRGLRLGDPLSPFLFLIVAEALSGRVRSSLALGKFSIFKVKGDCVVDIQQYADDTLLFGEGKWNHIWALKYVLCGLECNSGLGVNFLKSTLIVINTNPQFLAAVTNFLSCRYEDSEFKFIGIPIGMNPRRILA
ncbi:unnamed protein product [Lathyrus sativus]|nr:unnamed protein product [Lathyrus sativus]